MESRKTQWLQIEKLAISSSSLTLDGVALYQIEVHNLVHNLEILWTYSFCLNSKSSLWSEILLLNYILYTSCDRTFLEKDISLSSLGCLLPFGWSIALWSTWAGPEDQNLWFAQYIEAQTIMGNNSLMKVYGYQLASSCNSKLSF